MQTIKESNFFILSSEAKSIRRNLLLGSILAGFIGLTKQFPTEVSFLGMKFSGDQQSAIPWLIFIITAYFWLHSISISSIEFSIFVKPKILFRNYKKRLLRHPAFDETDFLDIAAPADVHNLVQVDDEARLDANHAANRMMKPLESMAYLKIAFDIAVPVIFPLVCLILLYQSII
jgi:hypothetical protein